MYPKRFMVNNRQNRAVSGKADKTLRCSLLREAKGQFEDQASFLVWTKAEFGIGKSETYACMGDLEAEREQANERKKKHRAVRSGTDKPVTAFDPRLPENIPEDEPLGVNDPRAPLSTAPNPDLYNTMLNSWEACLVAFRQCHATPRIGVTLAPVGSAEQNCAH